MSGAARQVTTVSSPRHPGLILTLLGAVVILLAFYAHTSGLALDLTIALRGFSILEVLEAHTAPEAFARDFPGGARVTTAASPTVYVYLILHDIFGIDGLVLNYAMILLEICTLAGGSYFLWRTLARTTPPGDQSADPLALWMFVCLLLVLTLSHAQRPNLANFGFPFFHGQFYGFADGLRLAGIALVLQRRWVWTGLVFTLCFTIHPIKALVGMAFVAPLLLIDWRAALRTRCLLSMATTLLVCGLWYVLTLVPQGAGVPLQDFLDYTRALQSHWYPMDRGFLGALHALFLSPFMALVLTSFAALRLTGWPPPLQVKMALGLVVLLGVTAIGIWASVDMRSATLIRICLIRASTLVTLLAPFVILAAAMECWRQGHALLASAFLALLWVAFHGASAMAPAFAVALALVSLRQPGQGRVALLAAVGVVVLVSAWLWETVPRSGSPILAAQHVALATALFWAVLKGLPAQLARLRVGWDGRALSLGLVLALFFAGGAYWSMERLSRTARSQPVATAYLEAQTWARTNTPPGTLFMVDPCRAYGWRDFSGRASLGTVREWFMTAWIYLDDARQLERGQRIATALGFDMEAFRDAPNSNRQICAAARKAYHRPDLRGQKAIAQAFGVDYFVFEKAYAQDSLDDFAGRFEFENAHFAILAAEDLAR